MLGKNLVPEMWTKILSANQIAGFSNRLYLYSKMVKKPDFLYFDTYSWKLKVDWEIFGWAWSEVGVATLVTEL